MNHGGWLGLGAEWDPAVSWCALLARAGYVVVESSFRGEDGSVGRVELCFGEGWDAVHMLDIALAQPYADRARVVMLGGSHGGCVTVRAAQWGAPAGRFASWNGVTDLADVYSNARAQIAAGASGERLQFFRELLTQMDASLGGPPEAFPAAYAQHSTITAAASLASRTEPLLLQHGANDDVVPVAESCRLVAALGGVAAYHIDSGGAVAGLPPRGCLAVGLTWQAGPFPPSGWPDGRYLIVYDGLDHGAGPSQPRRLQHHFSFLGI